MNSDVTPEQHRAEELYLSSVTYENDYKAISYEKLAAQLKEENIHTSSSALGRLAKKRDWKGKVAQLITASTIKEGEAKEMIEKSSLDANVDKILTDFEANEALKDEAYTLLSLQMKKFSKEMKENKALSLDKTKIVIKVLEVTTTREDKLLDRQAMLTAAKMTKSEDVLATLKEEVIDVEVDDG